MNVYRIRGREASYRKTGGKLRGWEGRNLPVLEQFDILGRCKMRRKIPRAPARDDLRNSSAPRSTPARNRISSGRIGRKERRSDFSEELHVRPEVRGLGRRCIDSGNTIEPDARVPLASIVPSLVQGVIVSGTFDYLRLERLAVVGQAFDFVDRATVRAMKKTVHDFAGGTTVKLNRGHRRTARAANPSKARMLNFHAAIMRLNCETFNPSVYRRLGVR